MTDEEPTPKTGWFGWCLVDDHVECPGRTCTCPCHTEDVL